MVDTSSIRLTVSGESVPADKMVSAWQSLKQLVAAVERVVVGDKHSPVRWYAESDPVIEITATANGVSKEQLDEIYVKVADGLVTGSESGDFPADFRDEAIQAARNVLRLLQDAEVLKIYTESYGEEEIRTARLEEDAAPEQIVGQSPRRRGYASVEGVLRMLSSSGKGYTASIKDRVTDASVKFSFTHEYLEMIKGLFDKNVVAEGMIVFTQNGVPHHFIETPTLHERARNTPLRSFLEVLPALPDGEMAEDFLERLNDGTAPA